jgi:hypothetical protein
MEGHFLAERFVVEVFELTSRLEGSSGRGKGKNGDEREFHWKIIGLEGGLTKKTCFFSDFFIEG